MTDKKFTHYSYLVSPIAPRREPTGMIELRDFDENGRRALIHNLMANGELLAVLPFPEIRNMRQLRAALKWEDENGTNTPRR